MCSLNFILFTCVNFIIFTQSFPGVQLQELQSDTQQPADASEITEDNFEFEHPQKVNWVDPHPLDPHDMFAGLSAEQLKELMKLKTPVPNPTDVSDKNDAAARTDNSKAKVSADVSSDCGPLNLPKVLNESCTTLLDFKYVTRWVKILLYRIEKESDKESSAIIFTLDSTILESLKDMVNAKSFDVSGFDGIISNLLAQAVITRNETKHIMNALVVLALFSVTLIVNCQIVKMLMRIKPQRSITGSRVEEVSTSREFLTENVHNSASSIQNECVEENLADDSTGLSKGYSFKRFMMPFQSNISQNNSQITESKVMEDELAIESGYFDAWKSVQPKDSDSEIDVNVKKTTLLTTETSSERLSIGDNSKVGTLCDANSMDLTRDVSSSNPTNLTSEKSEINDDEVSNLPESLSDSFEVLPSEEDNDDIGYFSNSHAVPNCDTSLDILQSMHASNNSDMHCSCRLCK